MNPAPLAPVPADRASTALATLSFDNTDVAFASQTDLQMRKTQLLFVSFHWPWLVRLGSSLTLGLLKVRFPGMRWLVKQTLFEHFCGGESIEDCEHAVDGLG